MMTSGAVASVDHRKDRRISHETAVPISLAVDLGRAHHEWQAGRSEHMVGGNFLAGEHFHLAGPHVGRAKKQLDHLLLRTRSKFTSPLSRSLSGLISNGLS